MNRWIPNTYHRNGLIQGYDKTYLKNLVQTGNIISATHHPVIFTLGHLSKCTNTQYDDLHSFVSRKDYLSEIEPHYRTFNIKKRTGGYRNIHVPHPVLRIVQSWIARNILRQVDVHDCAKAYKVGESIYDNALPHCGAQWLLKLDIKDFFSNISERQVYYVFRKMNYPALLSLEMAKLCTKVDHLRVGKRWSNTEKNYAVKEYLFDKVGSLPQGAPTSPALSNIVFKELDELLFMLSLNHEACYTRYADDLTFSFHSSSRAEIIAFKRLVSKELLKFGFNINPKKTRIVPPGARKIVTGLIVNTHKPSIPKEIRDKVKADLYYCEKYGVINHCVKNNYKSIIGFSNHISGMISFIYSIDPVQGGKFKKVYDKLNLPLFVL